MISDPTLFVECDSCHERIDFDFSFILKNDHWKQDETFQGWTIDWTGRLGHTLCPNCVSNNEERT